MIYAVILAAALLAGAAIFALVRAEKGESMLDRTVAFDVFTTTLVAAVALEAAWSRRTDTLVLLVVLSLVGFVGSVTISRFAAIEPEDAARLRTREEVEAERRAELAAVEAEQARRDALRAEAAAEAQAARAAQDANEEGTSNDGESTSTESDGAPSDPDGASTEPETPGEPDDEGSRS